MDAWRPGPGPALQAGLAVTNTDPDALGSTVTAEGANYLGAPVIGGEASLQDNMSCLIARVGRGQVVIASGGYYAPAAQQPAG